MRWTARWGASGGQIPACKQLSCRSDGGGSRRDGGGAPADLEGREARATEAACAAGSRRRRRRRRRPVGGAGEEAGPEEGVGDWEGATGGG
uniref:Uncharacterized protein n=1 Tax=Arundo donax TaxID=35708 RepID=A0A0A9ETS7_ARUDO